MLDFAVCAATGAQKESDHGPKGGDTLRGDDPGPKGDDTIKGDTPSGDEILRLMHSGKLDQYHPDSSFYE